ncbi:hypothetical protein D3C75_758200 [compost metagenome]
MLQHLQVHQSLALGYASLMNEAADGFRSISTAAKPGDRRHARIIPAVDMAFIHQQLQLTFARDCLGEIKAAEFILMRRSRHFRFCDHPVVERTLVLELQGAKGVRHMLNGILKRMSKGVHRIDAPSIARIMMMRMGNPVNDRITQVNIWRGHVNFGAKHLFAIFEFSSTHAAEQVQILFDRALPVRAVYPRLSQRTAVFTDLVSGQVIDVRFSFLNQQLCPFVHFPKII